MPRIGARYEESKTTVRIGPKFDNNIHLDSLFQKMSKIIPQKVTTEKFNPPLNASF